MSKTEQAIEELKMQKRKSEAGQSDGAALDDENESKVGKKLSE